MSTSPPIWSFTDRIKSKGFNEDFIEYDDLGLPPLYTIGKLGLQEDFGDKTEGPSNDRAGSEEKILLFFDRVIY